MVDNNDNNHRRDRGALAGGRRSRQDLIRLVHAVLSVSLSLSAWTRIRGVDVGAETTRGAWEQFRTLEPTNSSLTSPQLLNELLQELIDTQELLCPFDSHPKETYKYAHTDGQLGVLAVSP